MASLRLTTITMARDDTAPQVRARGGSRDLLNA